MAIINCELADNPHAHSRGLMFRDSLKEGHGMLFDFKKEQNLSFWGMNTLIPLDIAFIDKKGNIVNTDIVKPHCLDSVKSSSPCMFALEVPAGTFKTNNIKNGDFAEIYKENGNTVVFLLKNHLEGNIKVAALDMEPGGNLNVDAEEIPARGSVDRNVKDENAPLFGSVFDALKWCIHNHEVCRITYQTDSGHVITRDIEPHDIFYGSSKHHQILSTWDENANGPRSYIVMRIISYAIPRRKFTPKIQLY